MIDWYSKIWFFDVEIEEIQKWILKWNRVIMRFWTGIKALSIFKTLEALRNSSQHEIILTGIFTVTYILWIQRIAAITSQNMI